jgi:predicted helicase
VPILYLEAKDIGVSLDKVEKSEQMARYFGYTNLVLTDYLEFRFYRNGLPYEQPIKIASYDLKKRIITPLSQNYEQVAKTLLDFTQSQKEPIKSGKHLAKIMGGKAQRIRDNVRDFMVSESAQNKELVRVYEAIKKMLVHDLTIDTFSDMYAQTLVYGLFVARYYDDSPDTFSRQESRDLVPASNPFLQHFFDHIAGPNFDKRLSYIVDELCLVFQHADTKKLIEEYMGDADPVIHFYEDFLKEYDPDLRKKMGAYYTPLPVVKFIIRSVDYILQKEFNLPNGLADTSKLPNNKHRVQILDPAVGTGTFISATIRTIYERLKKQGQEGRWPSYVHNDLLPRLHGFELMMAPYTIAHLKLSLAFKQTGFWKFHRRLGIYLTNSLEQSEVQQNLLSFGFAESIAEEAKEADRIKSETPIMVVIGNPPYSISSQNKGKWILQLIKDYKTGLGERKINLDDDYIKFIRFAEHFIEKNKSGIVAMITNNSFIDGITHRQMRKHLLETFDEVYILDLHGNSKKKEKAPDGGKDENVFNIMQGVSISIFVRRAEEKKGLGKVYHAELYGKREDKFKALNESDIQTVKWNKLDYSEPYYFFVPKDFGMGETYNKGFKADELFTIYSSGIETQKDSLVIQFTKQELEKVRNDIEFTDDAFIKNLYGIKDSRDWNLKNARQDLQIAKDIQIAYRPFDDRWTFYSGKTKGILAYPRAEVMGHIIKTNMALLTVKRQTSFDFQHVFVSKLVAERCVVSLQTGEVGYIFPLYLYSEDGSRTPNLKKEIIDELEKIVGKIFPEDLFDYIYAILHSPSYREKYKEFLKIDFPRVPYPKDTKTFKKLVVFGAELRSLHLLESPKVNQFVTTYPIAGSDTVERLAYKDGRVFINAEQYFGNVPEIAWIFFIGGYQPAQKWLKDRKGRTLTNTDIEHYQKIIVALAETNRIMEEIDK